MRNCLLSSPGTKAPYVMEVKGWFPLAGNSRGWADRHEVLVSPVCPRLAEQGAIGRARTL